jgi:predicted RNA-binding Zn-ribbon protein involved in translation (DUF1610 family)
MGVVMKVCPECGKDNISETVYGTVCGSVSGSVTGTYKVNEDKTIWDGDPSWDDGSEVYYDGSDPDDVDDSTGEFWCDDCGEDTGRSEEELCDLDELGEDGPRYCGTHKTNITDRHSPPPDACYLMVEFDRINSEDEWDDVEGEEGNPCATASIGDYVFTP